MSTVQSVVEQCGSPRSPRRRVWRIWRKRIGVPITDTVEPWNYEATRDAIRHYAHGIGDDNPLWTDPAYAEKTKYVRSSRCRASCSRRSRIVSWLRRWSRRRACDVGGRGLDLVQAGSCAMTSSRRRRYLKDSDRAQDAFRRALLQQIYHVDFFNQQGDKVSECDSWVFRTDRDEARERGTKYTDARGRVEKFVE